jgi:hypothetical protein
MFNLAKEQGFNEKTLQRARKEIGVKCFQIFDDDGNNSWHWRLPRENKEKNELPALTEILKNMPKMPTL